MYRLLGVGLARGLLRAAGRQRGGRPARLPPGPVRGRVEVPPRLGVPRGRGPGLLPLLAGEGRGPGGRPGGGRARAGRGDFRAPSRSARLVLEARRGGAGARARAAGRGRSSGRGRGGRGGGRDHPAAEASQGEAAAAAAGPPVTGAGEEAGGPPSWGCLSDAAAGSGRRATGAGAGAARAELSIQTELAGRLGAGRAGREENAPRCGLCAI